MTGLRDWVRDPALPARCGQPELAPLTDEELRELLAEHALLPDVEPPAEIAWEYARWKPGVSMTCTYRLRWRDGHEETLVAKRYADDKVRALTERRDRSAELRDLCPRLTPRVLLPERGLSLWCPAADRELPGVAFLLDARRFARLVHDSGITEPRLIRRRRSEYEALRYKAERRAVFQARLELRDDARTRITLATRVHPTREAPGIAAARRGLETAVRASGRTPSTPRLLGFHERYGILLEEWLDVTETHEPDDFSHAREAGEVLAELHALPVPGGAVERAAEPDEHLRALFAAAEIAYASLHAPRPTAATWIHGDFHPDQVVAVGRDPFLIDLDRLALGDPATDVASWIADALFENEDADYEAAAAPLLEGYRPSGARLDPNRLRHCVADELTRRAAAAIRRLEQGAVERAERCLRRARALVSA
jgi:hypothetical protein